MWLVDFLRWYQPIYSYTFKEDLNTLAARSFLEILFCVAAYGGILWFCIVSYKLEQNDNTDVEMQPQETGANSQTRVGGGGLSAAPVEGSDQYHNKNP